MDMRFEFALDSAAIEDGGSTPDWLADIRKDDTLDERTAAHWARPTVPPRDLNCRYIDKKMRSYFLCARNGHTKKARPVTAATR
jgi:hypothetical protein